MLFDDGVYLFQQADGFGEGDDDFLVVGAVVRRKVAAFAVFEPPVTDLVPADVASARWTTNLTSEAAVGQHVVFRGAFSFQQ